MKRDQQVLLVHFDYSDGNLVWNGISGFIENGEKAEDAVLREVKEEIGIEIDKKFLEYKGIHKVSNELELEIFVTNSWNGDPEPKEKSILQLQWFDIENLPFDQMFPGNKEWIGEFIE